MGAGSYLDHLAGSVNGLQMHEFLVLPGFRPGTGYEQRIRAETSSEVRVLRAAEFAEEFGGREGSDRVLVLDTAHWPTNGVNIERITRTHSDYAGFIHAIAVGATSDRVRECVEFDADGQVQRVQRLYNHVSWPEVASCANLVSIGPARAISEIRFSSLPELRAALTGRGVLSFDLPIASDVFDLRVEEDLRTLNERSLARLFAADPPPGFCRHGDDVLVGRGCRIDPSAKLVGPVVLQANVRVEAGVILIGPTVIGSGSRIETGALVAQSVLMSGTRVTAGATVRQRVAWGRWSGRASRERQPARADSPAFGGMDGPVSEEDLARLPAHAPMLRDVHLALKRLADMVLAAASLLVLWPLMVIVAILIKLDSPGPVLFNHRREQKGGKEFSCFKFRTMVAGAHRQQRALYKDNAVDGPQFKLAVDHRITRVGRVLRGLNIDELPQLFNVLLGHMSLVGPRPSPFRENQICVPWRRARLSVRPGITGLWQVCRNRRFDGDFEQWIFYDILYVKNLSIWVDLKILLATFLSGGGRRIVPLSYIISPERQTFRAASMGF